MHRPGPGPRAALQRSRLGATPHPSQPVENRLGLKPAAAGQPAEHWQSAVANELGQPRTSWNPELRLHSPAPVLPSAGPGSRLQLAAFCGRRGHWPRGGLGPVASGAQLEAGPWGRGNRNRGAPGQGTGRGNRTRYDRLGTWAARSLLRDRGLLTDRGRGQPGPGGPPERGRAWLPDGGSPRGDGRLVEAAQPPWGGCVPAGACRRPR